MKLSKFFTGLFLRLGGYLILIPGFFLGRLKKTQRQENSSLKKITQNSSKKLKVLEKSGQITTNIDQNKGGKYSVMNEI